MLRTRAGRGHVYLCAPERADLQAALSMLTRRGGQARPLPCPAFGESCSAHQANDRLFGRCADGQCKTGLLHSSADFIVLQNCAAMPRLVRRKLYNAMLSGRVQRIDGRERLPLSPRLVLVSGPGLDLDLSHLLPRGAQGYTAAKRVNKGFKSVYAGCVSGVQNALYLAFGQSQFGGNSQPGSSGLLKLRESSRLQRGDNGDRHQMLPGFFRCRRGNVAALVNAPAQGDVQRIGGVFKGLIEGVALGDDFGNIAAGDNIATIVPVF